MQSEYLMTIKDQLWNVKNNLKYKIEQSFAE